VEHFRREILASTAFPGKQDGGGWADGHLREQITNQRHRRGLPDDTIHAVWLCLRGPQPAHFAPQPRRLERARHQEHHFVQIERLVGEMKRAFFHRLDGGFNTRVGRQQDDENIGIEFLDAPKD
jgi:hypothetical protein